MGGKVKLLTVEVLHFQLAPVLPENDLDGDPDILEIYIEVPGATDWYQLEDLSIPSKRKY